MTTGLSDEQPTAAVPTKSKANAHDTEKSLQMVDLYTLISGLENSHVKIGDTLRLDAFKSRVSIS